MKKVLIVLFVSMALVSCGNGEDNTDVVVVPESSTTTTAPPSVGEDTTTTTSIEVDTPAIVVPKPAKTVSNSAIGSKIGQISIPSIGLDMPILEGIDLWVLNKAPGHYPHSPKPCRAGNSAIAGHRTTYVKPFNKLDLLKDGDVVNISTPAGDCTYKYLRTEIVSPNNVSVVMPKDNGANLLTLTACHPKGSAAQRIVVTFELVHVTIH